jgi:hypothetical protein
VANTLFARIISHQETILFSQNKPAISNQPAVLFSQNKPALAISHQPNEQAVASKKMIAGSDKERNASKKFTIFKKWTKKEYKQHSLRKLTTTFRSAVLLARRCPPELRRVLVAIVPQMTASITSTFSRRIGDRSTTCTSPHTALLTCRILLRLALRLPLHPWW